MSQSAYYNIAVAADKNPMTAPRSNGDISPAFVEYLQLVYTPEEANVVQHLKMPTKFLSTEDVAKASGVALEEVERLLASAHAKNGLLGMGNMYCLPPIPILLNIHQFYEEVKENDVEAGHVQRKFFIDEKFYKYYETSEKGTPIFRTIPVEETIAPEQKVLAAEEAHELINNLPHDDLALVPCPCRTRTEKLGIRECKDKFPIGACLMLGMSALHFEMLGLGKRVTKAQAIDYFDTMVQTGLVGQTDNTLSGNSIICLCCDCCCSQLRGRTRWDNPDAILPSNFVPQASDDCVCCGTCEDRCFFGAIKVDEEQGRAVVADPEKCIGCGVCAIACPSDALLLYRMDRAEPKPKMGVLMRTFAQENGR